MKTIPQLTPFILGLVLSSIVWAGAYYLNITQAQTSGGDVSNSNVLPPINTGSVAQEKKGALTIVSDLSVQGLASSTTVRASKLIVGDYYHPASTPLPVTNSGNSKPLQVGIKNKLSGQPAAIGATWYCDENGNNCFQLTRAIVDKINNAECN